MNLSCSVFRKEQSSQDINPNGRDFEKGQLSQDMIR